MKPRSISLVTGLLAMGILMLSSSGAGGRAARAAVAFQDPRTHKVIAPAGLLGSNQEGIELWQDYGSFALYRVREDALAGLPESVRSQVRIADEMDQILIGPQPFNPLAGTPVSMQLPPNLSLAETSGPRLELVQFVGPLKTEWLQAIQDSGSQLVHYIANNAYLVWVNEDVRQRLDFMVARGDFLQYRAAYQPYFKLGESLMEWASAPEDTKDPDRVIPVTIQMYRHPAQAASEAVIEGLSVDRLSPWTPVLNFQNTGVTMRIGDIPAVAGLPDVIWIGERFEREMLDEVQGQILASNAGQENSGPSGPGYLDWLEGYGFSQDPQDYPVVDIVDDGIGDGTLDSGDPTLHVGGDAGGSSRLAYVQNCTSEETGGGQAGHGHLNASIMGGYDARSGFPYQDPNGFNLGLGINPFGRLAGTKVFSTQYDDTRCGFTDSGVIQASYSAGARISSNSWGCTQCAGLYDAASQAYDVGTRDAEPSESGDQPMTFVFAAGNSGAEPGTIGTPGNAKNVITVGASESFRPTWTDGCTVAADGADNAMDVIDFSSRGPAPGGRVKPELVAPGTHIQGTVSPNVDYDGSGVCDPYQPAGQTVFAASSGTSHSTPAVAGVASLYYYWLENHHRLEAPSPAMIKAYLIAHSTYLNGENANDTLPSNVQGYGMPDLSTAFDAAERYLLDQSVILDNSGETWTFNGVVADPGKPVRIVLAYTDQAGLVGTSPQVNNLDLQVVVNGEIYLGNQFEGRWSVPAGQPDTHNNVEAVYLPPGESGNLRLVISGFNIAGDGVPGSGDATDQDFALVCYNCLQAATQEVCTPGEASYPLAIGEASGLGGPVTLSASGQPAGTFIRFDPNPVLLPGDTVMTAASSAEAAAGSYRIDISGASGSTSTRLATAQLNLYDAAPGRPDLIEPAYLALDQPLRPSFKWAQVSQAGAYQLQIAADPQFENIVLSEAGLVSPSYTPPDDLEPGKLYYWRVRADNPCSAGSYSVSFSFTTAAEAGSCPAGTDPVTLFSDNFESGSDGWAHGGVGDTWALVDSVRSHSGTKSYRAVDPGLTSDQWLVSPPVPLPAEGGLLVLSFWNYQELERSTLASCYDGALLEVSTDGGSTWVQAQPGDLLTDPYDGQVVATSNPLNGRQAWCGDPQDWLESIVSLDAYAGQNVRFRFRLGSDYLVGREGWYVDDLLVKSCSPSSYQAVLGPELTQDASPGSRAVYHFRLLNLGFPDSYTLSLSGNAWPTRLVTGTPVTLGTGEAITVTVEVDVPPSTVAALGSTDTFTLAASGEAGGTGLSAAGTTVSASIPGVLISRVEKGYGSPGSQVPYRFTLTNTGTAADNFELSAQGKWVPELSLSSTGELQPQGGVEVFLNVLVPPGASPGDSDTTTVRAISRLNNRLFYEIQVITAVSYRIHFPYFQRSAD